MKYSAIPLILSLSATLVSCTYNISMAHTEGTATDTIDDTATETPTINPNISLLPKV